jgi:protein gp37
MPTKIEWCEESWNVVTGCTKISEGCRNCYAEKMAKRLAGRYGYPKDDPFQVTLHYDKLEKPRKWKKPRRIFVCSMGDLFHDDLKGGICEWEKVYSVYYEMIMANWHTYIVLTKRPINALAFYQQWIDAKHDGVDHIWLGVTAENQQRADERIPILLQIPAAIRFVSIEPMLESVDLYEYLQTLGTAGSSPIDFWRDSLDWVICGGESGPGARPMHTDWARSIRDQCQEAGVPFFMKQMSGRTSKERHAIPNDLMIREYPN